MTSEPREWTELDEVLRGHCAGECQLEEVSVVAVDAEGVGGESISECPGRRRPIRRSRRESPVTRVCRFVPSRASLPDRRGDPA
jgi:hypothetical protein